LKAVIGVCSQVFERIIKLIKINSTSFQEEYYLNLSKCFGGECLDDYNLLDLNVANSNRVTN